MGGGGLFLSNSEYRWDYRKIIVNEGGGERGEAHKNFTEPYERGQGKFNRDTTNILGPSPTPQTMSNGQSFICTLKTQSVY